MAPPFGEIELNNLDTLGAWHLDLGYKFEIGTLFTIIAGVLNLLAVYDAFAGPAIMRDEKKKRRKSRSEKKEEDPPELKDDVIDDVEEKNSGGSKKTPRKGPKPRAQKRKKK